MQTQKYEDKEHWNANLILVKIEEVKATVMLVDRMIVVVAPQMKGTHLVPLVYTAWTPAVHGQGTTAARVLASGVASSVRVALEPRTTLASRLATQNATGCSETTFDNRAWVRRAGYLHTITVSTIVFGLWCICGVTCKEGS